jgi:hypothetical protein
VGFPAVQWTYPCPVIPWGARVFPTGPSLPCARIRLTRAWVCSSFYYVVSSPRKFSSTQHSSICTRDKSERRSWPNSSYRKRTAVDQTGPAGAQEQIDTCELSAQNRGNKKLELRDIFLLRILLTGDRKFHSLCKYLVCETAQDPPARRSTDRKALTIVEEMGVRVRSMLRVAQRNTRQRG